ncbi:MAG: YlxR family protein [Bacillota bacterium]|nr:YlxR family protein [Bacillota bacterium]
MRRKHVPMRTCVGCRSSFPKKELVRIVRDPEGKVELDLTGKRSGRGAYLCHSTTCFDLAVKGKQIERALGVTVGAEVLEEIRKVLDETSI